jgi:hypothetical protein
MFRRVSGGRKESSVELSRFLLDVSITREVDNFSTEEVKGRKWKIGLPIVFRSGVLCGNRKQLRTSFQHVQSLSLSLSLSFYECDCRKEGRQLLGNRNVPVLWASLSTSHGISYLFSTLTVTTKKDREAGENKGR